MISESVYPYVRYANPDKWHTQTVSWLAKTQQWEQGVIRTTAEIGVNFLIFCTGTAVVLKEGFRVSFYYPVSLFVTHMGLNGLRFATSNPDLFSSADDYLPTFKESLLLLKKIIYQALGIIASLAALFGLLFRFERASEFNLKTQIKLKNIDIENPLISKYLSAPSEKEESIDFGWLQESEEEKLRKKQEQRRLEIERVRQAEIDRQQQEELKRQELKEIFLKGEAQRLKEEEKSKAQVSHPTPDWLSWLKFGEKKETQEIEEP